MKSSILLSLLSSAVILCSCGKSAENVVIYYSQTGTTEKVAECFAASLDADVIKLECAVPYPDTYEGTIEESRDEVKQMTGRELVKSKFNLKKYDTIYIGYPIWYGTFAPPIVTFLRDNDLAGNKVVLFCTYGSGGRLASQKDFEKMCPDAEVLGSYGVAARRVDSAAEEVPAFIASLGSKQDTDLLGGYSEPRELTEEDLAVFNTATANYGYLNLQPVSVSTQVVAGLNYSFECASNGSSCYVFIFRPLNGEPYLKAVERP